jgi:ribosomal protein L7/L12
MENNFAIQLMIEALTARGVDQEFATKYTNTLIAMGQQSVPQPLVESVDNRSYGYKVTNFGNNKIQSIKDIRLHSGYGLREAKQAVELATPIWCVSRNQALETIAALASNGTTAELVIKT